MALPSIDVVLGALRASQQDGAVCSTVMAPAEAVAGAIEILSAVRETVALCASELGEVALYDDRWLLLAELSEGVQKHADQAAHTG